MEHISSTDLMASGHRVTRSQIQKIKGIFPFMSLPAELRVMIFVLCLSFDGIETFFDHFYGLMKDGQIGKFGGKPKPPKATPNIFLVNRQFFVEASILIRKNSVRFHHGLLMRMKISTVISINVLQQLSSITISDEGHDILDKKTLTYSWYGYMQLFKELGTALSERHHLKKLVISFSCSEFRVHSIGCFNAPHACGYREQIKGAFQHLLRISGIKEVVINGFDDKFAAGMKALLEFVPTFSDSNEEEA